MQHLQPNTTLQGGKYRIERVLGQGGFGNTYKGYNTEFDEVVAIKEFFMKGISERDETTSAVSVSNSDNIHQFEEQREKFKKEARRLRKMKNKHIVKVHDLFEENGTAYYVMDYIDGESLSERQKRKGVMSEHEARKILLQILEALDEVHDNEIWHLDLKPGNIMLGIDGNVYLIDFGASKQLHADGNFTTSTAMCHTPGYAPSEQVGQMFDRFGPWTDLYALGATLYNLLTANKPPQYLDIEEDGKDAFRFCNNITEEMQNLVLWLMSPKRKDRPQSVKEVKMKMEEDVVEEPKCDSEETILSVENPVENDTALNKDEETEGIGIINEQQDTNGNDECTILILNKSENKQLDEPIVKRQLPNRAITVGDFLFDDGSYSDSNDDGRIVVGVLLSKYGGAHGVLISSSLNESVKSINGIDLKWHEATINDWVKVFENLGHVKVYYENGIYRYYSQSVRENLRKYMITEPQYISGVSSGNTIWGIYIEKSKMEKVLYGQNDFPKLYVSEF